MVFAIIDLLTTIYVNLSCFIWEIRVQRGRRSSQSGGCHASAPGGPVERFTDQVGVKHGVIREEQGAAATFTRILSTGTSIQNGAAIVGFLWTASTAMPAPWP